MKCGCASSQIPGIAGIAACERNRNIVIETIKYAIPTAIAVITGLYNYLPSFFKQEISEIKFKAFALSSDALGDDFHTVETSIRMKGTPGNDLMIAKPEGSEIFAIGGLNYMIAGLGKDKFYFSLCSTDIIDNKVGVIQDFDFKQDKIIFFCTKKIILSENITIFHEKIDDTEVTYVYVEGQEKNSAIALLGNIPLEVSDIELNQRWDMV